GRAESDYPETAIDLPVVDALHGLGGAKPFAPHILVLVEAGGLDAAEGDPLGGAAGRAGRYALALEIGQFLDAGTFDGHDVHAVRIEHHQGAQRDLVTPELVLPLEGIERGIRHRKPDLALSAADH